MTALGRRAGLDSAKVGFDSDEKENLERNKFGTVDRFQSR